MHHINYVFTFRIKTFFWKNCNIACDVRQTRLRATESMSVRRKAAVVISNSAVKRLGATASKKEENIWFFAYFQLNLYSIEIEQTAF